jgi:hypothetical protein
MYIIVRQRTSVFGVRCATKSHQGQRKSAMLGQVSGK